MAGTHHTSLLCLSIRGAYRPTLLDDFAYNNPPPARHEMKAEEAGGSAKCLRRLMFAHVPAQVGPFDEEEGREQCLGDV